MAGQEVRATHTLGWYAAAGRGTKKIKTHVAESLMVWQGTIADTDTPGNVLLADGTTTLELPKGFIPMYVVLIGAAASGNLDIGLTGGNNDALVDDAAADVTTVDSSGTSLDGVPLTADTVVTYTDGVSGAAGAGTAEVLVCGVMDRSVAELFMK